MCRQELDILDPCDVSPECWSEEDDCVARNEYEATDVTSAELEGIFECLQINLRKVGLGKHLLTGADKPSVHDRL